MSNHGRARAEQHSIFERGHAPSAAAVILPPPCAMRISRRCFGSFEPETNRDSVNFGPGVTSCHSDPGRLASLAPLESRETEPMNKEFLIDDSESATGGAENVFPFSELQEDFRVKPVPRRFTFQNLRFRRLSSPTRLAPGHRSD